MLKEEKIFEENVKEMDEPYIKGNGNGYAFLKKHRVAQRSRLIGEYCR